MSPSPVRRQDLVRPDGSRRTVEVLLNAVELRVSRERERERDMNRDRVWFTDDGHDGHNGHDSHDRHDRSLHVPVFSFSPDEFHQFDSIYSTASRSSN